MAVFIHFFETTGRILAASKDAENQDSIIRRLIINGVRSILEDKNGDFWFNTEYRYSIYDSTTLKSNAFYTRYQSIGGLDGKKDSNLDEYLSTVMDNNNNLWFVTYRSGVWKYDGTKITHYSVKDNSQDITLFSIYKDNNGDLWLGTHENEVYKFNGQTFEKFKP